MQIHGLQSTQALQSVQQSSANKATGPVESAPTTKSVADDQLDLSAEAQQISQAQESAQVSEGAEIRTDKVAAIRQAIADGSYETPEKLSAALDSMLDTFA